MSLTVAQIRQAAAEERDRLQATHKWAAAYSGAAPEEPLLVKPAPPAKDYYIVQFLNSGRTTGLMLVNPESGKISGVTGVQSSGESLYRFWRPHEIPAMLENYAQLHSGALDPKAPKDDRDRLGHVSAANVNVETALFWEPCDQSLTPFHPFYRVGHTGAGGIVRFLVRVDGLAFLTTTHGGAGM